MKNNFLHYNLILSGLITFLGLTGMIYLYFEELSMGAGIGAKLFPFFSLLIIFIFGVLTMIDEIGVKSEEEHLQVNILIITIFGALSILFVLFLVNLGLITATFMFLLVSFIILEPKGVASLKSSIIYSAFITLLIWMVFVLILGVILPEGLLI